MYKRKCNKPFTQCNSHKTVPFPDPAVRVPPNNTLLKQALRDDNLDKALDWLRHSAREQDNSDVWHLGYKPQYWALYKENLRQDILNNTFEFQVVRDVESNNQLDQRQVREIRSAKDRILIRALSQVLTPIIQAATPKECTHLANRRGLKGAVKDIQQQINQHPDAFVYKSDVKSYYASIENRILHDQLCLLFPNEPILCRLFWQFMQRTVERGGNYRDICKGIPLGSSLSPLLAAIYLIPLDKAFSQHPYFFYRRYMDDWVIICYSRRALRQTTKKVYSIMKSLHVEIHPKKTWLGKVKNGFDFLGFRITPTSIQPSMESVSRRDKKVARLYEQGASTKRIGQYLRRWLGWSLLVIIPASTVGAAPLSNMCLANTDNTGPDQQYTAPNGDFTTLGIGGFYATPTGLNSWLVCLTADAPDTNESAQTVCAGSPPFAIVNNIPFYVHITDTNNTTRCSYLINMDTNDVNDSITLFSSPAGNPTAVPLFTPIGIVATISGLLWFGRRRKAIRLTQN